MIKPVPDHLLKTIGRFGLGCLLILVCAADAAEKPATSTEPKPATDAAQPKQSEPAPATPAPRPEYDILTTKNLLGNWGGLRDDLAEAGISLRLATQQHAFVNIAGGLDTENGHDFAGSYDLILLLEFEKMELIKGADFIFITKGTYGAEAGDFDRDHIGAINSVISDAGAEEPIYVDSWWYRQRLFDNRVELRVGRVASRGWLDNSEYATSNNTQFENRAFERNPTIPHAGGLGVGLTLWPTDWLYFKGMVVDHDSRARRTGFKTAFHDRAYFRAFWEVGLKPVFESDRGPLHGNYRVGSWYAPGQRNVYFDDLDGRLSRRTRNGDVGFFLGCDQLVWRESAEPKNKQGLAIFARYGYAHGNVNFIEHFWSAGLQYKGLIPQRDADVLGFAVGQSIVSRDYRSEIDLTADRETVYELYYAIKLTPWLAITPDIQFINQPGANKDSQDALVAGIRCRVTF